MPFDPFSDRTARDLRNSLSTALVTEMTGGQQGTLSDATTRWSDNVSDPVYQNYLQDRKTRYQQILIQIDTQGITDVGHQAVVLWNAGLFFELHELLETIWQSAREPLNSALKGLIQAAGAYVHVQHGNLKAARTLATRAQKHLKASGDALTFIGNLDQLIAGLQEPEKMPPELEIENKRQI